jgi:hypothetical protein
MSNELIDRVSALLAEADNEVKNEFHNCEFKSRENSWDYKTVKDFRKQLVESKINFELVDSYGGEDQGSDYWSVYSFTDGMQVAFIKFDGWYASHEGNTYEQFYEVQPVEKTITVFETVFEKK